MSKRKSEKGDLSGSRVLITAGAYIGQEGVCLGGAANEDSWAVSPDSTNEILELEFEKEFNLLIDLSQRPVSN